MTWWRWRGGCEKKNGEVWEKWGATYGRNGWVGEKKLLGSHLLWKDWLEESDERAEQRRQVEEERRAGDARVERRRPLGREREC